MAVGNLLYLSVELVPVVAMPYIMMIARFITGSGTGLIRFFFVFFFLIIVCSSSFAGNAALFRTYAASASTIEDRSRAISCVTGGIAIGTMIGPGKIDFSSFRRLKLFLVSSVSKICFRSSIVIHSSWREGSEHRLFPLEYLHGSNYFSHFTKFIGDFSQFLLLQREKDHI